MRITNSYLMNCTKKSPNKKLHQKNNGCLKESQQILLIKSKCTNFEKPTEFNKSTKKISFGKRIRSLTSKLVLRKKSDDLRDANVKRCQSWPSYENNSSSSFANQLV